ncbi:MAG: hypothetical protein KDI77_18490, partial [Gammaproteobacteria bacterium]|nr:hypothetical protein [Gammaproteobacteria bacterium]
GFLQIGLAGVALHAEDFVVITLGHRREVTGLRMGEPRIDGCRIVSCANICRRKTAKGRDGKPPRPIHSGLTSFL